jgi:hypothetical protein
MIPIGYADVRGGCFRSWSASILSLFRPVESLFRSNAAFPRKKTGRSAKISRVPSLPGFFEWDSCDRCQQIDSVRLVSQPDYSTGAG